jgi:hypothetical protein
MSDAKRIKELETKLAALQEALDACNLARNEIFQKHGVTPGGVGTFREWVPDCSELADQVKSVSDELERARRGEPPTEGFSLPEPDSSKPPPYLGPDSQALYSKLHGFTTARGQAPSWLIWYATEGRLDPSDLVKSEILSQVSTFLKNNHTKLNGPEKAYWEKVEAEAKK